MREIVEYFIDTVGRTVKQRVVIPNQNSYLAPYPQGTNNWTYQDVIGRIRDNSDLAYRDRHRTNDGFEYQPVTFVQYDDDEAGLASGYGITMVFTYLDTDDFQSKTLWNPFSKEYPTNQATAKIFYRMKGIDTIEFVEVTEQYYDGEQIVKPNITYKSAVWGPTGRQSVQTVSKEYFDSYTWFFYAQLSDGTRGNRSTIITKNKEIFLSFGKLSNDHYSWKVTVQDLPQSSPIVETKCFFTTGIEPVLDPLVFSDINNQDAIDDLNNKIDSAVRDTINEISSSFVAR